MIRVVEAKAAGVTVGNDKEAVLEFSDADLKAMVGPQGAYSPRTGVLKVSGTGVISNITKMVCRRKDSPDQMPKLIFKVANGLTLDEFNDLIAHNTRGLDCPKYSVLGGYEIVLTLNLGTATSDISLITKGDNISGLFSGAINSTNSGQGYIGGSGFPGFGLKNQASLHGNQIVERPSGQRVAIPVPGRVSPTGDLQGTAPGFGMNQHFTDVRY